MSTTEQGRISGSALEALRLGADLAGLVGREVALRQRGARMVGLCPFHAERTPSFHVVPRPPGGGPGFYHCFGCGAHGDAIDWLMQRRGLSFREAVAALGGPPARGGGDGRGAPDPEADARLAEQRRMREAEAARVMSAREAAARGIWRRASALPPGGGAVGRYLAGRGITLAPPATLRMLMRCSVLRNDDDGIPRASGVVGPAMVAPICGADRRVRAVHCTFLDLTRDPPAKAAWRLPRRVVGRARGGAIRLSPAGAEGVLIVAEGIETALSVLQARRAAGRDDACWAGVATSLIPAVELPDWVRRVIVARDNDAAGAAVAARLAERLAAEGRRDVAVLDACPAGVGAKGDFNDMLTGAGDG